MYHIPEYCTDVPMHRVQFAPNVPPKQSYICAFSCYTDLCWLGVVRQQRSRCHNIDDYHCAGFVDRCHHGHWSGAAIRNMVQLHAHGCSHFGCSSTIMLPLALVNGANITRTGHPVMKSAVYCMVRIRIQEFALLQLNPLERMREAFPLHCLPNRRQRPITMYTSLS
jgi:hypothetical protein